MKVKEGFIEKWYLNKGLKEGREQSGQMPEHKSFQTERSGVQTLPSASMLSIVLSGKQGGRRDQEEEVREEVRILLGDQGRLSAAWKPKGSDLNFERDGQSSQGFEQRDPMIWLVFFIKIVLTAVLRIDVGRKYRSEEISRLEARDSGSVKRGDGSGSVEVWCESWHTLRFEPTRFADGLNVRERCESGDEDDSSFDLSNEKCWTGWSKSWNQDYQEKY